MMSRLPIEEQLVNVSQAVHASRRRAADGQDARRVVHPAAAEVGVSVQQRLANRACAHADSCLFATLLPGRPPGAGMLLGLLAQTSGLVITECRRKQLLAVDLVRHAAAEVFHVGLHETATRARASRDTCHMYMLTAVLQVLSGQWGVR